MQSLSTGQLHHLQRVLWEEFRHQCSLCQQVVAPSLQRQGGAQTCQKRILSIEGDQDGGSGGHLLGRRQEQVREKATGDLLLLF